MNTRTLAHLQTTLYRVLAMVADTAAKLVPLRTKDEVRASIETHTAYVIEIPARFANAVKE